MNHKIISSAFVSLLCLASCQENAYGTVDLSGVEPAPTDGIVYTHPCALYSAADFRRVRASLESGEAPQPVKDEFQALKSNTYVIGDYGTTVHAHEEIVRGDATGTIEGRENYADAMRDAAAAHQFGMLYLLTGDKAYADKGLNIINTWVRTCRRVTSNDSNQALAAGCQGYTFALAIEELRDQFTESDLTAAQQWLRDVFAAKNYQFLMLHGNTNCGAKHYWSNWDLVNLCSYFQIGIVCEDDQIIDFVIEYFTASGIGNGALHNLVLAEHDDPLGTGEKICQGQESGRDQGHACMAALVAAQLAQSAWSLYQDNPTRNLDFYGADNNALLKMLEYVALTNLRAGSDNANASGAWLISASDINARAWTAVGPWCTGATNHEAAHQHTQFADDKGRGGARPGWEAAYQHYRQQGIASTKYIQAYADKLRPECGAGDSRYGANSGAFDQIGWGTLMTYQAN